MVAPIGDDDDEDPADALGEVLREHADEDDVDDDDSPIAQLLDALQDATAAVECMTLDHECDEQLRERHQDMAASAVLRVIHHVHRIWDMRPDDDDDSD